MEGQQHYDEGVGANASNNQRNDAIFYSNVKSAQDGASRSSSKGAQHVPQDAEELARISDQQIKSQLRHNNELLAELNDLRREQERDRRRHFNSTADVSAVQDMLLNRGGARRGQGTTSASTFISQHAANKYYPYPSRQQAMRQSEDYGRYGNQRIFYTSENSRSFAASPDEVRNVQRSLAALDRDNQIMREQLSLAQERIERLTDRLHDRDAQNEHLKDMLARAQQELEDSTRLSASFIMRQRAGDYASPHHTDRPEWHATNKYQSVQGNGVGTSNSKQQQVQQQQPEQGTAQQQQQQQQQPQESGSQNAILKELMRIMCVREPQDLIQAALKYEQCIKIIPKMERFIKDVCNVVWPNQQAHASLKNMNEIINTLKQWSKDRETASQAQPQQTSDQTEQQKLYEYFQKCFDVQPGQNSLIRLNQVYSQTVEYQNFIRQIKKIAQIDSSINVHDEDLLKLVLSKLTQRNHYKSFVRQLTKITQIDNLQQLYGYIEKTILEYERARRMRLSGTLKQEQHQ